MADRLGALPFIDVVNFQGEVTKVNPDPLDPAQLKVLENAGTFTVYQSLHRVRGNKRLLNAVYQEGGNPAPLPWVGFYKYPDANGRLQRDVLFTGGTTLRKLNNDGTSTELASGLNPTLSRTSTSLDRFMFISGQNPINVGQKDRMMKYDGVGISSWGLQAPGEEETLIQGFETLPDTVIGTAPVLGNTITWDGTNSLEVVLDGSIDASILIYNVPSFAIPVANGQPDVQDRMRVRVYVDPQQINTITNEFIHLSFLVGGTLNNAYQFRFNVGDLVPGWNNVRLNFLAPSDILGSPDPQNLTMVAITVERVATATGQTVRGIHVDRMVLLDRGTPSAAVITTPVVALDFEDSPSRTVDLMDSATGWTVTGVPGNVVVHDLLQTRDLQGSITWEGNRNTAQVIFEKTNLNIDVSDVNVFTLWFHYSNFIHINQNITPTIQVELGDLTLDNADIWQIFRSDLAASGWNFWNMFKGTTFLPEYPMLGSSLRAGQNGTGLGSTVQRIRITLNFTSATPTSDRVHFDAFQGYRNNYLAFGGNTIFQNTSDAQVGTSRIQVNKLSMDPELRFRKNNLSLQLVNANGFIPAGGRVTQWLKVQSQADLTNPGISIKFGDQTLANYNEYVISKSDIESGWKQYAFDLANPINVVGSGANFQNINAIEWIFRFSSAQQRVDDYGIDAIEYNTTGGGFLVGDYSYRATYVSKYGIESNAGPVSGTVSVPLGGGEVTLSQIPISSDSQVVSRKIYRTVANGDGEWLFLTTIPNNSETTFLDGTPDESLGVTTPPEAGNTIFDSSPPPMMGIVKRFNRTIFGAGDPLNPNFLYFSRDNDADSWPLLNSFELDSRITGIYDTYLGLMVTTDTDHWRVIGDNPDYFVEKVIQEVGATGPRAVGTGRLEGWSVDQYAMRMYDLRQMQRISEPIQDQYVSLVNREDVHTVHSRRHNAIIQFNKGTDNQYRNNFLWTYKLDTVRDGGWSRIVIPNTVSFNPIDAAEVEDDEGNIRIYVGSSDGMLYELFADSSGAWVGADGIQQPIGFVAESHWIRRGELGQAFMAATGKITPRFFELRAKEMSGLDSNWKVVISTSHGSDDTNSIVDSVTLNLTIPAGWSFVRVAVPARNAAEYFKVRLECNDLNKDVVLHGYRLYFLVTPSMSAVEPAAFAQSAS